MGTIIPVNKDYGDFFLVSIEEINWDEANDTWDKVYADSYYATYLQDEYGIIVPPPYEVLWDHAITLQITISVGGKPGEDTYLHKGKKKKKIKLIFMIDNLEKVFEKDKNDEVKVEFKNQVENQLSEQFGQKVILEDVQIIHR